MFLAVFTTIGLFGLDPTAPKLARPAPAHREDVLSVGRLVFLGAAVAAVPIVGARAIIGKNVDGLLLAISVATIAVLVMTRIYGLSAQRDRYERALRHEATHDALTGLLNRREFVARLRAELSLGPGCAILFCDLDGFKAINDQLGHDAGDAFLVETARRLRACVRECDVVSRFGGDEFLILLQHTTLREIEIICERIAEALSRPVVLPRRKHDPGREYRDGRCGGWDRSGGFHQACRRRDVPGEEGSAGGAGSTSSLRELNRTVGLWQRI